MPPKKITGERLSLAKKTIEFFEGRGIAESTLEHFGFSDGKEFMRGSKDYAEGETMCMQFNYWDKGQLINIKYRAPGKRFKLVSGAKLIFYNIDAIDKNDEIVICEGEIDCMTLHQCGILGTVSVPNGASKGNARLEYLDNCIERFEGKDKIIIATDDDDAGSALRDELIRRLGRYRCWTIRYPEGCKDANEVLLSKGSLAVRKMIAQAKELPLEGIFTLEQMTTLSEDLYRNGPSLGDKVGYAELDRLISFKRGEFTVITGIPGSGKSSMVDQIMLRLASRHGWRFGVFSPEQQPSEVHVAGLVEKYIGEPYYGREKMSEFKMREGVSFVNNSFYFMNLSEVETSIDGILEKSKELVVRYGIHGFLIDPYNYIEHKIPSGYSETQYVSELLTKIKNFCKNNNVHIFLIAHPTKIQKDKSTGKHEVPTLYSISGSAHFYNKADNGFTVYRDFNTNIVTVHVQKIRFRHIGKIGNCEFTYDVPTGRYAHFNEKYESEYDRKRIQDPLEIKSISEPKEREPGELTSIFNLPLKEAPF